MTEPSPKRLRRLVVVCGDQLDTKSAAFDGFDPATDAVLMTEAREEATYVAQHKRRLVLFFAAMRHFAGSLRERGFLVLYNRIDAASPTETLANGVTEAIRERHPEEVVFVRPGDHRVMQSLSGAVHAARTNLRVLEDTHFFSDPDSFTAFREGRKRLVMEDFYRMMRRRTGLLMDGENPAGGAWNFDKDNRGNFGKEGPGLVPERASFRPDAITAEVIETVERLFPEAPGSLDSFDEPVTRADALAALDDFISNRLRDFGRYQDAMWSGSTTLWHSRLSTALNLKLLNPREACAATVEAYEAGHAPINAAEGFVRQILGWREFIRGVYWTEMPDYAERNSLNAENGVPVFFWTGETRMACLHDSIGRLLETGYAHHIERLMVLGLYLMLHGAHPYKVHEWHMALYLDAVDWVSLPNVLGMSQHGDDALVGTKPYCASGAYIDRMSNHCGACPFDPKQATGDTACPFTTLYWDFLARHRDRFVSNPRMKLQIANLDRKNPAEIEAIRARAADLRASPV